MVSYQQYHIRGRGGRGYHNSGGNISATSAKSWHHISGGIISGAAATSAIASYHLYHISSSGGIISEAAATSVVFKGGIMAATAVASTAAVVMASWQ